MARSKGEILTGASYVRKFVKNHLDYKNDSEVTDTIITDLIDHLQEIIKKDESPEMLGDYLDFLSHQCTC